MKLLLSILFTLSNALSLQDQSTNTRYRGKVMSVLMVVLTMVIVEMCDDVIQTCESDSREKSGLR